MPTLTIRRLNEQTPARLRSRAAAHGRPVEGEVRAILDAEVGHPEVNILVALHDAARETGGVDLEIPARTDRPRTVDL